MNTKNLANHYAQLTAEERFRLLMAAGSRGDDAEGERLLNAGQRIHLTFPDHAPYAHAFQELLFLTYIELLEDAALFQECNERFHDQLRDSIEAARTPKRKKTTAPRTKGRTRENYAVEYPDWHHSGRMVRAVGFLFKVKLQGWKLFCERLNVPPVTLWEQMDLPGLDRLKRAVALAHAGTVFSSAAEMAIWANEVRPAGDPERTEADILTAEWFTADLDAVFRERIRWWGG
jgi:hypothetical protein